MAFESLKSALLTAPVFQLADVSKLFWVYTDASNFAKEISEGYGNDPELSHIMKRLKNSNRDVFQERHFWDERKTATLSY